MVLHIESFLRYAIWPDSKLSNASPTSLSARLDSPPASADHATDDVLIPLLGRGNYDLTADS
jgi:hypothetical protein